MISNYKPLEVFLRQQDTDKIQLTFKDVEQIVGELPKSAWKHRAWWSNNDSHTNARNGWRAAGWKTSRVDMEAQSLTFIRDTISSVRSTQPSRVFSRPSEEEIPPDYASMDTALSDVARSAGGLENLMQVVRAIEQYVAGEILEVELGRIIRKYWPR